MPTKRAVLISYDTKKKRFKSLYERNKFYRGLFGFKQTVKKNGKKYKYSKEGLLDEIPHIKVEDSVFIVSKKHLKKLINYFEEWKGKVSYDTFKVILEEEDKWKEIEIE